MTGPALTRWVVVAESPFLPARGGGGREHLGFVWAAAALGLIAALILPSDDDPESQGREDDLPAIRRLVAPAPVIVIPRQRSLRAVVSPRPYVVTPRLAPDDRVDRVRDAAPDADAVVIFHHKSSASGNASRRSSASRRCFASTTSRARTITHWLRRRDSRRAGRCTGRRDGSTVTSAGSSATPG